MEGRDECGEREAARGVSFNVMHLIGCLLHVMISSFNGLFLIPISMLVMGCVGSKGNFSHALMVVEW